MNSIGANRGFRRRRGPPHAAREAVTQAEQALTKRRGALQEAQAERARVMADREAAEAALRGLEARAAELSACLHGAEQRLAALGQQVSAEEQLAVAEQTLAERRATFEHVVARLTETNCGAEQAGIRVQGSEARVAELGHTAEAARQVLNQAQQEERTLHGQVEAMERRRQAFEQLLAEAEARLEGQRRELILLREQAAREGATDRSGAPMPVPGRAQDQNIPAPTR